jgi:hypothetical protein
MELQEKAMPRQPRFFAGLRLAQLYHFGQNPRIFIAARIIGSRSHGC